MSTRSKKKKRDGRAQDQGMDTGVRRPVIVGTVVLLIVTVGMVGILAWPLIKPVPAITKPTNMEALADELRILIDNHIEMVSASPRDARLRATLGLVYEANELWPLALSSYKNATAMQSDEPMWPHHAAIAWLETGDIEGATTWLHTYTSRFPTFAPLQDRMGAVFLDAGKIDEAMTAFEVIIELAPTSPAGYIGYGDALLRAGDHEASVAALEKAVRYDPKYKLAHYLLGRAYRALGRLEDAEREMTVGMGASRYYVTDQWGRQAGRYKTGIGALQVKSAELIQSGKFAEAAKILEQVLVEKPDDAATAVNLGIAYLEMNRLTDAERVLLNAERLDPTRFEIYINLSACFLRQKRLPEALQYIDRAVELSPTASQAHLTRGLVLMKQQENELAWAALTTAAGLDARNPKITQELANVCTRLGRIPQSVVHYQALTKLLPTRWEPHFGMARALRRMGQLDAALAATNRGLALAPNESRLLALARQITGATNP